MPIRDRIKETVANAAKGAKGAKAARGTPNKPAGFGQAFEDLLSFAGDLRGQASGRMQGELEKLAAKLDLVTRREFEAVRAIAIAARTQAERLEAQLSGKTTKPAAKPAARKPATKKQSAQKPAKQAGKKPAAKRTLVAKGKAALPLLLQDSSAALSTENLQALFAYLDREAQLTIDLRDSAHDRLFGVIMARVDALQARRDDYLQIGDRLKGQPLLWPLLLREAGHIAISVLQDAGLLADDRRRHLQVAGLAAVLATTLRAWQTDTATDLPATLRACDTALRRGATAAAWLGVA